MPVRVWIGFRGAEIATRLVSDKMDWGGPSELIVVRKATPAPA